MHRRRSLECAILASALTFVTSCSGGGSEKKLLDDFFRASRVRDNVTLGNFATATFDPRTDGIVQGFEIVTISNEKVTPLPLKKYVKAVEDAKAADAAFSTEKRAFQNANIVAIDRVLKTQAAGKAVSSKDRSVKEAWDKWSTDAITHKKAVSAAQRQLNDARGIAELSLSRPNGPTADASQYDGQMVMKEVTLNATVRDSKGQIATKPLKATLHRALMKDEKGQDLKGRWIVTSVTPA
jgi:hypothetical protein